MNEVVIPLKITGIAQMKAELRELKGSIANATDPAQMTALAQKAGVLTDKIKDANEAVKVFATGSKFEQVSNGLGGIKSSLMSLDFAEAAEKSKVFATALGGINKADISKSLKGAMDMTKTLGTAFLKLGVQILMNPIFLLVTVIAGVVAAVGLFLNKLGVLTSVMNAIKAPFKAVIQGFKDLTDWMGITDNAAEENARIARENAMAHVAANDLVIASSKQRQDIETEHLGRSIAILKSQGKNTYQKEIEQSDFVQQGSYDRLQIARKSIAQLEGLNDQASVKKHNKIMEQIEIEKKINLDAQANRMVLQNTEAKRISDQEDKAEKISADKAKAARDKRIAADKASEADIAVAAKLVSDSKKTAQQIELDDLAADYKIKIAEATKHKNNTAALVNAQAVQEAEIKKKYTDAAKATEEASRAANIAKIDAYNLELAALTDTEEQKLYDKYAADLITFEGNELALFNISKKYAEDTTALKKTETDKQKAIDAAALQAKKSIISSEIDAAKGLVNLLGGLGEKNKKMQKAALIANAALSIAEIINNTNVGSSQEVATKGVLGLGTSALLYIKMATSIASVVAATAKGLSALGGGTAPNSSSGGGGGGGGDTSTTAVAPAAGPQLFGNANTGSQMNAGGGTGNNITVTAVVSETEITASQSHINNIQQNSVL